jgi:hypothetical protein
VRAQSASKWLTVRMSPPNYSHTFHPNDCQKHKRG